MSQGHTQQLVSPPPQTPPPACFHLPYPVSLQAATLAALKDAHATDIATREKQHEEKARQLKTAHAEAQAGLKKGWERSVAVVRDELDECETRHATAAARVRGLESDLEHSRREVGGGSVKGLARHNSMFDSLPTQMADLKRAIESERNEARIAADGGAAEVSVLAQRVEAAEGELRDALAAVQLGEQRMAKLQASVTDAQAESAEAGAGHEKQLEKLARQHSEDLEGLAADHEQAVAKMTAKHERALEGARTQVEEAKEAVRAEQAWAAEQVAAATQRQGELQERLIVAEGRAAGAEAMNSEDDISNAIREELVGRGG